MHHRWIPASRVWDARRGSPAHRIFSDTRASFPVHLSPTRYHVVAVWDHRGRRRSCWEVSSLSCDVCLQADHVVCYYHFIMCRISTGAGRLTLPANAPKVFAYAGRHGYIDLLSRTAPPLLGTPSHEVVSEIPGHLIIPWVRVSSPYFTLTSILTISLTR